MSTKSQDGAVLSLRASLIALIAAFTIGGCTESATEGEPEPEITVDAVTVHGPATTLEAGATIQLTASALDEHGAALEGRTFAWVSADEAFATVSPSGMVTGVAPGIVRIDARDQASGVAGGMTLTVIPAAVHTVRLSPTSSTVIAGDTAVLEAVLTDARGAVLSGRSIEWRSSDDSVATVDSAGVVSTHEAGGPVTITALSEGRSDSAQVTVLPVPVAQVTVMPDTTTVLQGESLRISATATSADGDTLAGRTIEWTSSDSAIASVDAAGMVTGVAVGGPVTIRATIEGVSGQSAVSVAPVPVERVVVDPDSALLLPGDSLALEAHALSLDGDTLEDRPISWSSADTAVARVDANGLVRAVAQGGPVAITADIGARSASAHVTVAPVPVAAVVVAPDSATLATGDTIAFAVLTLSASGDTLPDRTVSWFSSDMAVASVDTAGVVRALAAGSAQIVASSEGVADTAALIVSAPVEPEPEPEPEPVVASVVIEPDTLRLQPDSTLRAIARAYDADGAELAGQPVTWSVSDTLVIGVDTAGVVTARAAGVAHVIASAGGMEDSALVVVTEPEAPAPPAVASVALSADSVLLFPDSMHVLTVTVRDSAGLELTDRVASWTSRDTTVASVDAGAVTASAPGATFVVVDVEGVLDSAIVAVIEVPVAAVVIAPDSLVMTMDSSVLASAIPYDAAGGALADRLLVWTTLDATIATVDGAGRVSPVAPGETGLVATSEGVSDTAVVQVITPATAVLDSTRVTTGTDHACALDFGGAAYCWGRNDRGQLGIGSLTSAPTPTRVDSWLRFESLAAGSFFTCGLTATGAAHCWGTGGSLGDGTGTLRTRPVAVDTDLHFSSIVAGNRHACGLTADGQAHCWGDNANSQIGDSVYADALVPQAVKTTIRFTELTAGSAHTCGIDAAGQAFCWGRNADYQLGQTTASVRTPAAVQTPLRFVDIEAGISHTCGLAADGVAYCWGSNSNGGLGDGTTTGPRETPAAVTTPERFTSLSLGWSFSCGLTATGAAHCWGANSSGQLGDSTRTQRLTPVAVAGGHQFRRLAASENHVCAEDVDGEFLCWGYGNLALGDGSPLQRTYPAPIAAFGSPSPVAHLTIDRAGLFLAPDSSVDLGVAATDAFNNPLPGRTPTWRSVDEAVAMVDVSGVVTGVSVGATQIVAALDFGADTITVTVSAPLALAPDSSVVAAGTQFACATAADGETWCWGRGDRGQIGDGRMQGTSVPAAVAGEAQLVQIAAGSIASCGLSGAGAAYCWGGNDYGQLGDGSTTNRGSPVEVIASEAFVTIDTDGTHSCALNERGAPFCWGDNGVGQLGDGSTTSRTQAVAVATDMRFVDIATGSRHTCALTVSGEVYCWGDDRSGQLGTRTYLPSQFRTTPAPIASAERFVALDAGNTSVCALTADGAAWCWGAYWSYTSPGSDTAAAVPTAERFDDIVVGVGGQACALTAAGAAFCWNAGGVPALVAGHAFTEIAAGSGHQCGMTTTKELRCWGNNTNGALGDGTATTRSEPTLVLPFGTAPVPTSIGFTSDTIGMDVDSTVVLDAVVRDAVGFPVEQPISWTALDPAILTVSDSGRVQPVAVGWGRVVASSGSFADTASVLVRTPIDLEVATARVAAGDYFACALDDAGATFCWGSNGSWALGDGTTTSRSTPGAVVDAPPFTFIAAGGSHACGLTAQGEAHCWGSSTKGQLGLNGGGASRAIAVASEYRFATLALGTLHTCGLTRDGELICWGWNYYGQLGDPAYSSEMRAAPTPVPTVHRFVSVAAGNSQTCAVEPDGDTYCVGLGEGAGGTTGVNLRDLTLVAGGSGYESVTAGAFHTCGVSAAGVAECWGDNGGGQLGDGTTVNRATPAPVASAEMFDRISAGTHINCALTAEGQAFCWGYPTTADGDSSYAQRLAPNAVTTTLRFSEIAASDGFVCALATDGAFYCWGENGSGRLGNGTSDLALVPTPIAEFGAIQPVDSLELYADMFSMPADSSWQLTAIAFDQAGFRLAAHVDWITRDPAIATVDSSGRVWSVAQGDTWVIAASQGVTDSARVFVYEDLPAIDSSRVAAGTNFSCALDGVGQAYCWGANNVGQVGDGTIDTRAVPVPVATALRFRSIVAGTHHVCAVTTSGGDIYCWGFNNTHQLGNMSTISSTAPVASTLNDFVDYVAVVAGTNHTCGLAADGKLYCWGANDYAQMGNGTRTDWDPNHLSAGAVAVNLRFVSVSAGRQHTCGLTANGVALCWGDNTYGQVGVPVEQHDMGWTELRAYEARPVAVETDLRFASLTTEDHTCGLTAAGAMYCWGRNAAAQLGDGTLVDRHEPAPVSTTESFTSIAGDYHTCALTSAGAAYCWGYNQVGQVGDGTTVDPRTTPVAVQTGASLLQIATGFGHTCALAADDYVYCWGYNLYGQVGDGTGVHQYVPVVVSGEPLGPPDALAAGS